MSERTWMKFCVFVSVCLWLKTIKDSLLLYLEFLKYKQRYYFQRIEAIGMTQLQAFKIGLVQMHVGRDKGENIRRAEKMIREAASNGAKIVALPECFTCPYEVSCFKEYSETIPGEASKMLSRLAKEFQITIIGGSFPEEDDGKYYNTAPVHDSTGKMIAKFSKVHLCDVYYTIPGKDLRLCESDVLSAGDHLTMFDTPFCKIGIAICYDFRFAEMAQIYAKEGCKLILYMAANNMATGPPHWDLIHRARAVDNQVYVAGVAPARDNTVNYVYYGHSLVCSPWGDIVAQADESEQIVYADIDLNYIEKIREIIPSTAHKRPDLYKVVNLKGN